MARMAEGTLVNTLANVPMRFLEEGAVLLRPRLPPLLNTACDPRPQSGNALFVFRCLESWDEVSLWQSEIIEGCVNHDWEILKRASSM